MTTKQDAISVLLELTRRLTEKISLEEALRAVTEAAIELLPGEHASVRVLDDSGTELLCGARSGEGKDTKPMSFRKGEGVVGWVVASGQVALIKDTVNDPRFKAPAKGQGFSIRSMLVVPLWSAGRCVGVLGVTSSSPEAFDENHETMGRLLSNCAVPPIEKARLERLSLLDHHTKAFNQRYLYPRLEEEIELARNNVLPLSILIMDLDGFKAINDQFGHNAGDEILRAFSDRVRVAVRRSDVFIRRGGDEFLLIMPQTTEPQAAIVAERFRRAQAEARLTIRLGHTICHTVSIGVATWNGRETAKELEFRADVALYEAKKAGRNAVHMAPLIVDEDNAFVRQRRADGQDAPPHQTA